MILLSILDVIEMHDAQLEAYGGEPGVRDMGLLESAVAQVSASFDGVSLHTTPAEIAATYLFHLVKNHAFIDGNKRIALASALVFLDLNGLETWWSSDEAASVTERVATSEISKGMLVVEFEKAIVRSPSDDE